jgi:hypothetical protein
MLRQPRLFPSVAVAFPVVGSHNVVGKPETGLGEINGSLHDFPEAGFGVVGYPFSCRFTR